MSENLFRSTSIVSAITLLSRIIGFLRDVMIARLFGAGLVIDVFLISFKIPNFLRRLFAEGALSQAFIPILAEYRLRGDMDLKYLIANTSGTLACILFIITTIGILATPILVIIFAPGFINNEIQINLANDLLLLTFPYLFFISLTALAGAILNFSGRFIVPTFTPVLLNLSLIGCTVWLSPKLDQPVIALSWGIFFGGIMQLLFQIPFLISIGQLQMPRWGWHNRGVQKIIKLMLPAIFSVSISQINLLLDTILASFLTIGSISWLYYSERLVELPLGVIGIALSTVILPCLSIKYAIAPENEFSHTIDWALRCILVIGTPAAIGLIFLAEPLLLTLFQYGEFSLDDAHKASLSLMAYGVGLLPFILVKVLATGYFARQDTKTPVKIGIITMIINMILNIILMLRFAHVGLAIATSLSGLLNSYLLFVGLRILGVYRSNIKWHWFISKLFVANFILLTLLLFLTPSDTIWAGWNIYQRFSNLLGIISITALMYFTILALMGINIKNLFKL